MDSVPRTRAAMRMVAAISPSAIQQLERSAASSRLGIARELNKLINKKTPTMPKEQVLRKMREGGLNSQDGEEECIEGLTLYETYREPIPLYDNANHTTTLQVRTLNVELTCPICLGIMRNTMTVMECLHRFCDECISKCLRWGKKECPTCRVHCSSRRHLRPDPNFDALIATVYPNLDEYEEQEEEFIADINKKLNRRSLTESVEKGILRQAAASRGTRARRDKEKLEAMEATSTQSVAGSSSRKTTSLSSSSRKRKPSSSSASAPGVAPKSTKRPKQPRRQRSADSAEEVEAVDMELDKSGIPLAHYHIPQGKPLATTAPLPSVAQFLDQMEKQFISFVLLPHPNDEQLQKSLRDQGTNRPLQKKESTPQRPCLRTSKKVQVKDIAELLTSKFSQLLAGEWTPSSLDLIHSQGSNSSEEGENKNRDNQIKISIAPTATLKNEDTEREKEGHANPVVDYVELQGNQTIGAIASQLWGNTGDLTLYYHH